MGICSIKDRWAALMACFTPTVAIITSNFFSLVHAHHSKTRKFIGVQYPMPKMAMQRQNLVAFVASLALSQDFILIDCTLSPLQQNVP
jgi:hypothetical protein